VSADPLPPLPALVALGALTAGVGAIGGVGGAILLVPALVLLGVEPLVAAPLGLLLVAAGSLAAAPAQLAEGLVHHRLGVTLEIAGSAGVILGALASDALPGPVLARLLGLVAIAAALVGGRRKGVRNRPRAAFAHELPGEWPGSLGGSYRLDGDIVPYTARRLPLGLLAVLASGVVSGVSGVGGGFIKTPAMSEIMHVPVKVAAATTTFTVAVTAAAGLIVYAGQGRIDVEAGAAVVVGGLVGGTTGALLQRRLGPGTVRVLLSVVLVVIGATLVVRG
jgi:uncharacterized membrane protein YfcA